MLYKQKKINNVNFSYAINQNRIFGIEIFTQKDRISFEDLFYEIDEAKTFLDLLINNDVGIISSGYVLEDYFYDKYKETVKRIRKCYEQKGY